MSAVSGRSICASPELQFIVPEASVATVMITQALAGGVAWFGIVSGPPKKQPGAFVQLRMLWVCVEVVGPIVAVCPVQPVSSTTQCRLFGGEGGREMELPPPPTYMPPHTTGVYSLPSALRTVPQVSTLTPSLMKLEYWKPPQQAPPIDVDVTVDDVVVVMVPVGIVVTLVLVVVDVDAGVGVHEAGTGAPFALSMVSSLRTNSPPKRAQYFFVSVPTASVIMTSPPNGVAIWTPAPLQTAFTIFCFTRTTRHGSETLPEPLYL